MSEAGSLQALPACTCPPRPHPPSRPRTPPLQHVCGDGGVVHVGRHAGAGQARQRVGEGPPGGVHVRLGQQLAQALPGHPHRGGRLGCHGEAWVAPRQQAVAAGEGYHLRRGRRGRCREGACGKAGSQKQASRGACGRALGASPTSTGPSASTAHFECSMRACITLLARHSRSPGTRHSTPAIHSVAAARHSCTLPATWVGRASPGRWAPPAG